MKLNQVLVVYKQVSRLGNELHIATLNDLYEILKDLGVSFDTVGTRQLKNIGHVDLVITVGGDGTVLTASHFVENVPILGIKSFGRKSVGYFCAATRQTMRKYLGELFAGKRRPIELHRLQTSINGQKVAELALNDVLFTHISPASTTKYKISIGGHSEEQKSSGVWVSSAAGSTAAVRAAGGKVLPLTSNKIEYFVREPYYVSAPYKILNSVLSSDAKVKITSETPQGTLFIDGAAQYPAPEGATIVVQNAKKKLKMYWR